MNRIKFSQKFGKLQKHRFNIGNNFTTFRKFTDSKFDYYMQNTGVEFGVMLKGKQIGTAKLLTVRELWSQDLTIMQVKRDTYNSWWFYQFEKLLEQFYGVKQLYGLWLTFKITGVTK